MSFYRKVFIEMMNPSWEKGKKKVKKDLIVDTYCLH